jgi:hypothetical protein
VAMEMLPFLGQLRRMDDEPEQAARFASTLAAEVLKLPPDTATAIERIIAEGYSDLKRDGLTLSAQPEENVEAWTGRRDAADKALATRVFAALPETARNHPLLKMIGADEEPTILLPSATSVLGSLRGGADGFLRARPKPENQRKEP